MPNGPGLSAIGNSRLPNQALKVKKKNKVKRAATPTLFVQTFVLLHFIYLKIYFIY